MNAKVERLVEGFKALGKWGMRGLNADIARETGFTASYVGKVFKGVHDPADKFYMSVCEKFGLDTDYVLKCTSRDHSRLNELLQLLDSCGIPKYGRNIVVAEKTGYAPGMVAKVLTGHAAITDRFLLAIHSAFDAPRDIIPSASDEDILLEIMRVLCGTSAASAKLDLIRGIVNR